MRRAIVSLLLACMASPAHAQDGRTIAGRTEVEWRDAMASLEREAESARETLDACEAREAPAAYDGISGIVRRDERGRLYGVEIVRCDEARAGLAEARSALEDFEENARRSGVPPGWLR